MSKALSKLMARQAELEARIAAEKAAERKRVKAAIDRRVFAIGRLAQNTGILDLDYDLLRTEFTRLAAKHTPKAVDAAESPAPAMAPIGLAA